MGGKRCARGSCAEEFRSPSDAQLFPRSGARTWTSSSAGASVTVLIAWRSCWRALLVMAVVGEVRRDRAALGSRASQAKTPRPTGRERFSFGGYAPTLFQRRRDRGSACRTGRRSMPSRLSFTSLPELLRVADDDERSVGWIVVGLGRGLRLFSGHRVDVVRSRSAAFRAAGRTGRGRSTGPRRPPWFRPSGRSRR